MHPHTHITLRRCAAIEQNGAQAVLYSAASTRRIGLRASISFRNRPV